MAEEKNSEYLNLENEIRDIRYGSGQEKIKGGLKAFGKGLWNTGKYTAKELVPRYLEQVEKQAKKGSK